MTGEFAYGSDLWMDDMLWGVTLRSPHPYARIRAINIGEALATAGVYAVLTARGRARARTSTGSSWPTSRCWPIDVVRYQGEPVALVAADHPEIARQAAKKIGSTTRCWEPVTDARDALGHPTWNQLHDESPRMSSSAARPRRSTPRATWSATSRSARATPRPTADVVVTGEYEVGMQDQAFLGPESGLAVPDGQGGVDLYVATQWLHVDQRQVCAALGLPPEQVRLTLAGVGGAFGGREDLSMHVHGCMLALHTGKPVKMVYNREESFFGHVHRHPAEMRYEHGATRDGKLVFVNVRDLLRRRGLRVVDTRRRRQRAARWVSAPMSCRTPASTPTASTPTTRPAGRCEASARCRPRSRARRRWTGSPPSSAWTRSSCASSTPWRRAPRRPTGQVIDSPAPVAELLRRLRELPLPEQRDDSLLDLRSLPGGVANTTHGEGVKRGVGYAVAYKNVAFSEGFDDYSTARVQLEAVNDRPVVVVHTAAAEVGQGLVTIEQQICRTELGVDDVIVHPKNTDVGSGGSTSASRQTYMTGGAVKLACEAVRDRLLTIANEKSDAPLGEVALVDGNIVSPSGDVLMSIADALGGEVIEETREHHHRPTQEVDEETGQGFAHVQYSFSAHRAVVDVDVDLGLLKVVELACAQDVGKAINPGAVVGQIQGGSTQGMGLAIMEEIVVKDGKIRNPSFTDYLIPTILDTPPMPIDVLELPDPHAPYGLRGAGEAPTISSGPAVASAIRQATGLALARLPVRPEHITGT